MLTYNKSITESFEITTGGGFEPLMELINIWVYEFYDRFKNNSEWII